MTPHDMLDNVGTPEQLKDFMSTVPIRWQLDNKSLIRAKFDDLSRDKFEPVFLTALRNHQFEG